MYIIIDKIGVWFLVLISFCIVHCWWQCKNVLAHVSWFVRGKFAFGIVFCCFFIIIISLFKCQKSAISWVNFAGKLAFSLFYHSLGLYLLFEESFTDLFLKSWENNNRLDKGFTLVVKRIIVVHRDVAVFRLLLWLPLVLVTTFIVK